jgi:hypothetical protein
MPSMHPVTVQFYKNPVILIGDSKGPCSETTTTADG